MKKYSKIFALILALVMVFAMFSGFTYKPSDLVAMGDHSEHAHSVSVDNLALVSCSACGGDGVIRNTVRCGNCPACLGSSYGCQFPTYVDVLCSACGGDGSIGSPDPVPTSKPTPPDPIVTPAPTTTPAPTATPNPAICEVSTITYVNDVAYTLDIDNYIGETAKIEILGSSSKGHTLSYEWKKDGVAINNTTAIYTEVCNAVGVHTLDCTTKCATCNVTSSETTKITTTEKKDFDVTFVKVEKGFLGVETEKNLGTYVIKNGTAIGTNYDFNNQNFLNYSSDKAGKVILNENYLVKKNLKVYVNYKEPVYVNVKYLALADNLFEPASPSSRHYGVHKNVSVEKGSILEVLKYDKQWQNRQNYYNFKEWTLDIEGLQKLTSDYVVTDNITLYAQYDESVPVAEVKTNFFLTFMKSINSWWNTGTVAIDYIITIAFLLLAGSLIVKIILAIIGRIGK